MTPYYGIGEKSHFPECYVIVTIKFAGRRSNVELDPTSLRMFTEYLLCTCLNNKVCLYTRLDFYTNYQHYFSKLFNDHMLCLSIFFCRYKSRRIFYFLEIHY